MRTDVGLLQSTGLSCFEDTRTVFCPRLSSGRREGVGKLAAAGRVKVSCRESVPQLHSRGRRHARHRILPDLRQT